MHPVVGIDVSRDELVVAVRPSTQGAVYPNTAEGHQQLIGQLPELAPFRVLVEPTGGLERALVEALEAVGLPVRIGNPYQIRQFARGIGQLAKTDPIDAAVLAHYAEVVEMPEPVRLSTNERGLRDLIERRRQLRDMHTAELNRRPHMTERTLPSWERMVAFLDRELEAIEAEIAALVKNDPTLQQKATLMQTAPGIGPVTSATLLGRLPELGSVSGGAISALAGVAPYTAQSGKMQGRAMIRGGRADVRSALYVATMTAKRFNPVIRAYYDHLIAAHKPHKVAMIACERKLLVILNAMMRDGACWNPEVVAT